MIKKKWIKFHQKKLDGPTHQKTMRGRKVRNALKATQAEQYSNASIPLLLKIVIDRVFEVDSACFEDSKRQANSSKCKKAVSYMKMNDLLCGKND